MFGDANITLVLSQQAAMVCKLATMSVSAWSRRHQAVVCPLLALQLLPLLLIHLKRREPLQIVSMHSCFFLSFDQPSHTWIILGDEYYLVKSGDSCSAILSEYNITLAQFYSWNPSVGSDCTTMLSGYYYCVGVSGK